MFETFMQTRDTVNGMPNFGGFFQLPTVNMRPRIHEKKKNTLLFL